MLNTTVIARRPVARTMIAAVGDVMSRPSRPPRNDYAELKRLVEAQGLMARQPRYYAVKFTLTGGLLLAGLTALGIGPADPWFRLAGAVFLAAVFGQIALLAHDVAHGQVFSSRGSTAVGLVLGNLLLGVSRGWWRRDHDAHHAHPNDLAADPNAQVFVLGNTPEQARSRPAWAQWIIRRQAFLLFPLFTLQYFNMHLESIQFVRQGGRGAVREGWLLAAHFAVYAVLLPLLLGVGGAVVFALVHHALVGLYLGSIFAPNHKGMPMQRPGDPPLGFLREQVLTARNVRGGWLTDLVYGGLNYQIEHHLFPSMPRNRLQDVQPLVRDFCKARGVAYYETGVVQSFREILGHFRGVSRALA